MRRLIALLPRVLPFILNRRVVDYLSARLPRSGVWRAVLVASVVLLGYLLGGNWEQIVEFLTLYGLGS